jgi:hypothetical protein
LEDSFQEWLRDKGSYLTEDTLKLIEKTWRECGLENMILKELFNLWNQVQSEGLKWEPTLVHFTVKDATKWAKGIAERRGESVCQWLQKSFNLMRNYYKSMAPHA